MSFKHSNSKFTSISSALNKSSRTIGSKRGFYDQSILQHWKEYVGDDIAQLCRPREVKAMRGRGATLVLDCISAQASEVMMRSEEIRAKLNSRLGENAIVKIQLHHQHIGFDKPKESTQTKPKTPRPFPPELKQDLEQTQNDELRNALLTFSRSFYNKGDK